MVPSSFLPFLRNREHTFLLLFLLSFLFLLFLVESCSSPTKTTTGKSSDNTTETSSDNTTQTLTDNISKIWGGLLDNNSKPRWTAAEVVALLDSPTNIDNLTGCGHRNYMSIGGGGGIMYPDGIERSSPTGYFRHGSRYYVYDKKYEIKLGYWNDWLGLSYDLEEALDNYTKTRNLSKIEQFQGNLELSDAELESKFAYWGYSSVQEIKDALQKTLDGWISERDNTKVTFAGYPLIYPDNGTIKLETSSSIKDVGYWDFSESGVNSVEGGYDWSFYSSVKGVDAYIHNGILDVPYLPSGEGWGVTGSVDLKPRQIIDNSLDREAFTLALSVFPELLPTEMPSQTDIDNEDWTSYHEKHSPKRLLFSFGTWYRWLQIYINEKCHLEANLNLSPYGDYRLHKSVYLVSDVELDIRRWNEIHFTIDVPKKLASMTVFDTADNQSSKKIVTEIFTLPDDFEWSFESDWKSSSAWHNMPNINYVDNNLGIFSGSGSGSFAGKLDWVYLANEVMGPEGVETRVGPLRGADAVKRKAAEISVASDGYVASAKLSTFDYPEWKVGAFVNSSMRNNLLNNVYSHFEDKFDFIFLLQNETESNLGYQGMYIGVSNDIMGISEDKEGYDKTKYTGSNGKLKAVIHFPTKSGVCCGPSLHELMHHWGNYSLSTGNLTAYSFDLDVEDPEDELKQINAGSHWGVSSVNGQLGGFDLSTLQELGGNWYTAERFGTYANGGNSIPYGNFELYLMGLIPPHNVTDVVLFRGLKATAKDFLEDGKWYAEEKTTVSVEDVINKLGPRVPDYTASQKKFRILTLILTDDNLTSEEWSYFSGQAKGFESTFLWATGNRASAVVDDLDKIVK